VAFKAMMYGGEIRPPTAFMIETLKLLAYVGEDEFTGELGIKQVAIPGHGRQPLVARASKPWVLEPDLKEALQRQADLYGKPIYLVRYKLEEIVETITPTHHQQ
jgi:hypothetical protein